MAEQRLHSALAPIDLLTRLELEDSLHKNMDWFIRDQYRGLDLSRIPNITVQGNGGTVNLGAIGASDGIAGPEQGDIWLLRHVNVVSTEFLTDPAKYFIFRGSTPSDPSSYSARFLLDSVVEGGLNVGVAYDPGNKAIYLQPGEQIYCQVTGTTAGNTYVLSGDAIRCPAEMKGKIL
jgi:hypothetical protein